MKKNKNPRSELITNQPQGFSLIETAVALTTLGVCMAYALPLFLYSKISNSKNEVRTGALIVAQRTFDIIRSKSIPSLPENGSQKLVGTAPNGLDPNPNQVIAMGKTYDPTIYYCEKECGPSFRSFRVEVKYKGEKVYELEGNYTDFK